MGKQITIKVKTTPDTELKTVHLPYFSKSAAFFYKVTENEKTLTVGHLFGDSYELESKEGVYPLAVDGTNEPCTEQEFNEAYEKALQSIVELKNQ